jgi:hypothetical protein
MHLLLPLALILTPAMPAASCSNVPNTASLRADLRAAHAKLTDRPFSGPRKSETYAGRCGSKGYALASFRDKELGFTDQPERFTRKGSSAWKDRGDTGGDVCGAAPVQLLRIWGIDRNC